MKKALTPKQHLKLLVKTAKSLGHDEMLIREMPGFRLINPIETNEFTAGQYMQPDGRRRTVISYPSATSQRAVKKWLEKVHEKYKVFETEKTKTGKLKTKQAAHGQFSGRISALENRDAWICEAVDSEIGDGFNKAEACKRVASDLRSKTFGPWRGKKMSQSDIKVGTIARIHTKGGKK